MGGRSELYVERRYANGRAETLQALAEELVRANVEVIVTSGTTATLAAKRATTTVPIVFAAGDPVLLGLVPSLARPGGNVTGYSQAKPEIATKYLSLLKELLPALRRVGVLEYSANPYYRAARAQYEATCRSLGLEAVFVQFDAGMRSRAPSPS
jgi:putative ABC transport system substrate-binding protein